MRYCLRDSNWDENLTECYQFSNEDLRECDVITVYSPGGAERVGLIVRQSALFSEDSEIIEHKCLANYASRWLKDYLKCDYADISEKVEESNFLNENTCYFFLHKPSIEYLDDIESSVLAFMFCNGFDLEGPTNQFFSLETRERFKDKTKNERLKLHSIIPTEASKYLLKECFPKIKSTSDPLSQFIILYQFFEVLMEILFEPKLKNEYTRFEQRQISKNDFRQIVSDLSKESTLLAELLKNISNKPFESITAKEKEQYLSNDNFSQTSDIIYKLRNGIFHRTRLFINSDDLLRKANYALLHCIYECLRTDLLCEKPKTG